MPSNYTVVADSTSALTNCTDYTRVNICSCTLEGVVFHVHHDPNHYRPCVNICSCALHHRVVAHVLLPDPHPRCHVPVPSAAREEPQQRPLARLAVDEELPRPLAGSFFKRTPVSRVIAVVYRIKFRSIIAGSRSRMIEFRVGEGVPNLS